MKHYRHILIGFLLTVLFLTRHPVAIAGDESKLSDAEVASIALVANQVSINYAKIAKQKSTNTSILKFAETMITDHMNFISDAAALNSKFGVAPKDNAISQKLLNDAAKITKELRLKSGKAFDNVYIDSEVAYHKSVITAMETQLIPETTNDELKKLLQNILLTFKSHLEQAITIQKNLSNA